MIDNSLLIAIIACGSSVLLYLLRILSKKFGADVGTPPPIMATSQATQISQIIPRVLSLIKKSPQPVLPISEPKPEFKENPLRVSIALPTAPPYYNEAKGFTDVKIDENKMV